MQTEGEPDLDKMAQRMQNLFKFIYFYDYMDFNPEERLAMTKSIIEVIDPSGKCGLVEIRSK